MSENNIIDQEGKMKINPMNSIFTLENAMKFYKKFSEDNPFKCSWVPGMEGELIQYAYKSGEELVVERIHVDELEDAGDWDHVGYSYGTEMLFSLADLKYLTRFMEEK